MVTVCGTVSDSLSRVRVTRAPPEGAGAPIVTLHLAVLFEASEAGVQDRLVRAAAALRPRTKLTLWPAADAVTVAVESASNAPAVTGKLAELEPAATVTDGGKDSHGVLAEIATGMPSAGAGWLSVIVQLPVAACPRAAGLQTRLERVLGATSSKL
ncbi:MAG: hypothetical protein AMXMBFR13_32980 [Phycisphaerae bacterium]